MTLVTSVCCEWFFFISCQSVLPIHLTFSVKSSIIKKKTYWNMFFRLTWIFLMKSANNQNQQENTTILSASKRNKHKQIVDFLHLRAVNPTTSSAESLILTFSRLWGKDFFYALLAKKYSNTVSAKTRIYTPAFVTPANTCCVYLCVSLIRRWKVRSVTSASPQHASGTASALW